MQTRHRDETVTWEKRKQLRRLVYSFFVCLQKSRVYIMFIWWARIGPSGVIPARLSMRFRYGNVAEAVDDHLSTKIFRPEMMSIFQATISCLSQELPYFRVQIIPINVLGGEFRHIAAEGSKCLAYPSVIFRGPNGSRSTTLEVKRIYRRFLFLKHIRKLQIRAFVSL